MFKFYSNEVVKRRNFNMKNKIETVGWITVAAGLVGLLVFTLLSRLGLDGLAAGC